MDVWRRKKSSHLEVYRGELDNTGDISHSDSQTNAHYYCKNCYSLITITIRVMDILNTMGAIAERTIILIYVEG